MTSDAVKDAIGVLVDYVDGRDDDLSDAVWEVRRQLAIEAQQGAAREVLALLDETTREAEARIAELASAALSRTPGRRVSLMREAQDVAAAAWRNVSRTTGRRCARRRKDGKRCMGAAIDVLPYETCHVHATELERRCGAVGYIRVECERFGITVEDLFAVYPPEPPAAERHLHSLPGSGLAE